MLTLIIRFLKYIIIPVMTILFFSQYMKNKKEDIDGRYRL